MTQAPLKQIPIGPNGQWTRPWWMWFVDIDAGLKSVSSTSSPTFVNVTTTGGRIKETTRVTTTYQILVTDNIVYGDTDSSAFTVTMPVGVDGQEIKVINSGTGLNILTVAPSGAELLIGENSTMDLNAGEALYLVYQTLEGWQ